MGIVTIKFIPRGGSKIALCDTVEMSLGSLRKALRQRHVGRHQTIALMSKTIKLHVSPPSSPKQ